MLDSIGYFLKPIEHTVYIALPGTADPLWYKFIMPVIGFLSAVAAASIAVIGWQKNSEYARKNQKKAFRETVLDRIRVEFNQHFLEYEKWMDELKPLIENLLKNEDARRVKLSADIAEEERAKEFRSILSAGNNVIGQTKKPEQKARQPISEPVDLFDFAKHIKEVPIPKFFRRFMEYSLLFPNFLDVVNFVLAKHWTFVQGAEGFCHLYNEGTIPVEKGRDYFHSFKIEHTMLAQLQYQIFQFFQYECLSSLEGIKKPDFTESYYHYIHRHETTGMLSVVKSGRIHSFTNPAT